MKGSWEIIGVRVKASEFRSGRTRGMEVIGCRRSDLLRARTTLSEAPEPAFLSQRARSLRLLTLWAESNP